MAETGDCFHSVLASTGSDSSLFPDDLFTLEQRRNGALLLHLFGLIYMFIALSVVCDEFFVPSLSVLTEKLSISDDVAGATFMAAGGSAPEFFTSLFGVFVTQNNVGIGTIVGSATFNILCVLAFCTLFSREALKLTWWPIFRDSSFYIFALLLLVLFFLDEKIEWYEAISMFIIYLIYAIAMKYNEDLEKFVKFRLRKVVQGAGLPVQESIAMQDMAPPPPTAGLEHRKSVPVLHSGALYRSGVTTLARRLSDSTETLKGSTEAVQSRTASAANDAKQRNRQMSALSIVPEIDLPGSIPLPNNTINDGSLKTAQRNSTISKSSKMEEKQLALQRSLEESEAPLDISWPSTIKAQLSYLFLAPITLPLYCTLPDTKNPSSRQYYVVTFVGSVLWIALFSYLMVWWASVIGETLAIPNEIMGLTVLAAGTSIPDLITSVIVARKGLGDMAVSSSIGSNLFDISVGLPIPWLLQFTLRWLASAFSYSSIGTISVVSKGLICSVGMLFLMLIVLIAAAAVSHWKMDKIFGTVMIVTYVAFCAFSVLLELGYVMCPLTVGCR